MRVLFVASPLVGHVLPLVPLATAFRDAGHDVVLATGGAGVGAAAPSGLPVRDVAPGFRTGPLFARIMLTHPRIARREMAGRGGTDGVGLLFAAVAERMAAELVDLVDGWRPDLVVHEPLAAAGTLAAARHGVPVALVDLSLYDPEELLAATATRLTAWSRRYGVGTLPVPAEVVRTAPPSVVEHRRGRLVRYVPATATGDVPAELFGSGDRPIVLVTRTTVPGPGRDLLMSRVVDAAAGADLDLVLVRPDRRVARRRLPAGVRTVDWLPFADVLPRLSGIVHHGGAGTLMTAFCAGIPQLAVPGAGDRRTHAELLAARGAGLAVEAADLTTADLQRLVTDPALRVAAREVAAEIAALPHPADVVEPLVALAR
ncbi:glycosyltransferase [Blastococcus sp. VKM Ac-2987]|uniref:glycosyltransferase n=1 Tax=Blastococcus sp. VKM Ac-2987 TaxID=3004141 RepID=UPI0022AB79BF|nr:glycosyltransferase [Blastococcus sp. VKM Ac-2987]MCZ2857194.1 glycosyltransferase [Blastococcus sp. VKM Ac-2987]